MSNRPILGAWATLAPALALALALAAAAGCYTGTNVDPNGGASRPEQSASGTEPGAGDLPCDVANLLAGECQSCHGASLAGGAPNRLVTRADLMARPDSDPSRTIAEIAIARMRDPASPMPPTGALPDASIASLETWVADGYPAGACGGSDVGDVGATTASVCTSGTYWTRGDHESPLMHPGGACIDCHSSQGEGPLFGIAGTLYPSFHEPTDCNGTSAATVVIVDAAGKTLQTLTPNAAGNFFSSLQPSSPFRAKVVAKDGKVREMKTLVTSGDCNSCHTEKGAQKAPGRVTTP